MQEDLIDAKAVAKRLGLNYHTVVDLTASGEIPGFKVGKKQWRYRPSDIDAYIQRKLEERKHDGL